MDLYQRLPELNNAELLSAVARLATSGQRWERQVLEHLLAVDERQLHLALGFPSLFEFTRQSLQVAESTAGRWISVARASRQFPTLLERLGEGRLNLTSLALLVPVLSEENCETLLSEAEGLSTRAVDRIVATLRPRPAAKDVIRSLPDAPADGAPHAATDKRTDSCAQGLGIPSANAGVSEQPALTLGGPAPTRVRFKDATRVRIHFDADASLVEKIAELRGLLSHRLPEGRLEDLLALACEALLEKSDPLRKRARKEARRAKRQAKAEAEAEAEASKIAQAKETQSDAASTPETSVEQAEETHAASAAPDILAGTHGANDSVSPDSIRAGSRSATATHSRYIPVSVREAALHDAGGRQCTFVGADERRCTAKAFIQFDHRLPYAKGGSSTDKL